MIGATAQQERSNRADSAHNGGAQPQKEGDMPPITAAALDKAIQAFYKGCEDGLPAGRDPQDWMRSRMERAVKAVFGEATHG